MAKAKQFPKYMVEKVNRVNRLMEQIVELNTEIEQWLEDNGVTDDGFDFMSDYRENRGYEILWTDDMISKVNEALNA